MKARPANSRFFNILVPLVAEDALTNVFVGKSEDPDFVVVIVVPCFNCCQEAIAF